jgi:hypothetical protein
MRLLLSILLLATFSLINCSGGKDTASTEDNKQEKDAAVTKHGNVGQANPPVEPPTRKTASPRSKLNRVPIITKGVDLPENPQSENTMVGGAGANAGPRQDELTSRDELASKVATLGPPPQVMFDTLGMSIRWPAILPAGTGESVQLLVRFFRPDGRPLMANPREQSYRDESGLATTGTPRLPIRSPRVDLGGLPVTLPYYALNLRSTDGRVSYLVLLVAYAYIDGQLAAQSRSVRLSIPY